MALGPGIYDDVATTARERTQAKGVVLIVIDGAQGNGFSVQAIASITHRLPEMLRSMADMIEADITP